MNVFEAVKQAVTTRQAVEHYGFRVNRSGKIACPFHNDRTPSMKVDNRFHCFGCGADGDVIDFVARLYGLGTKEAAEKLAQDFGMRYEDKGKKPSVRKVIKQKSEEQRFRELEQKCFRVLSDYLHLLKQWEQEYAPKTAEETWHPLFVEALQRKTQIEYLLDILLHEPITERAFVIKDYGKEVMKLEQRISGFINGIERRNDDVSRYAAM